jgi:hypothetical protein
MYAVLFRVEVMVVLHFVRCLATWAAFLASYLGYWTSCHFSKIVLVG